MVVKIFKDLSIIRVKKLFPGVLITYPKIELIISTNLLFPWYSKRNLMLLA